MFSFIASSLLPGMVLPFLPSTLLFILGFVSNQAFSQHAFRDPVTAYVTGCHQVHQVWCIKASLPHIPPAPVLIPFCSFSPPSSLFPFCSFSPPLCLFPVHSCSLVPYLSCPFCLPICLMSPLQDSLLLSPVFQYISYTLSVAWHNFLAAHLGTGHQMYLHLLSCFILLVLVCLSFQ